MVVAMDPGHMLLVLVLVMLLVMVMGMGMGLVDSGKPRGAVDCRLGTVGWLGRMLVRRW